MVGVVQGNEQDPPFNVAATDWRWEAAQQDLDGLKRRLDTTRSDGKRGRALYGRIESGFGTQSDVEPVNELLQVRTIGKYLFEARLIQVVVGDGDIIAMELEYRRTRDIDRLFREGFA